MRKKLMILLLNADLDSLKGHAQTEEGEKK